MQWIEEAVLQFLLQNPNTHTNVIMSASSLIARIFKVSFSKDMRYRKYLSTMSPFFNSSLFAQKVGLDIMTEIVTQTNQYLPCIRCILLLYLALETKTLHRSSCAIFRDIINLPLMKQALSYLPPPPPPGESITLTPELICLSASSLHLINAIMSFDYSGCQSDGANEEIELIQLPSEWSDTICQVFILYQLLALSFD